MMKARHIEQEIEDLDKLSADTAQFISASYDWVSTLRQHSLLDKLHDFSKSIDAHKEKLEKDLAEAQQREREEDADTDAG